MSTWIVLGAVAFGTYALRATMFVLLGRQAVPNWAERPMSFVAPAAVAAMVASMLLTRDGSVHTAPVRELVAVGVGFAAVRRTGNVMHAFALGLPAFWLLGVLPS